MNNQKKLAALKATCKLFVGAIAMMIFGIAFGRALVWLSSAVSPWAAVVLFAVYVFTCCYAIVYSHIKENSR